MPEFINEPEPDLSPVFSRDGRSVRMQVMVKVEDYVRIQERADELGFSDSTYFYQLYLKDIKEQAQEKLSAQLMNGDTAKLTQLLQLVNEIQGNRQ